MIAVLMSITLLGCKDSSKKENPINEPNLEEKPKEMEADSKDKLELGCYEYKTEENDVKMEVTKIEADAVTAKLYYSYAEKDKNVGTFSGNIHGDKLMGQYTFTSEGKESVRDVVFKIEKKQIVEGFGELNEAGTKLKDTTNITYSSTTPWKKVSCN